MPVTPRLALLPVTGVLVLVAAVVSDLTRPAGTAVTRLVPDPASAFAVTGLLHLTLAAIVLLRPRAAAPGRRDRRGRHRLGGRRAPARRRALGPGGPGGRGGFGGAETALLWLVDATTGPLALATGALLLLFPTGRFLPGGWGLVGRVALAVAALPSPSSCSVRPRSSWPPTRRATRPTSRRSTPRSLPWLRDAGPVLAAALTAGNAAFLAGPVAAVVVRYRRTTGVERDRMRWLLWGVLVVAMAWCSASSWAHHHQHPVVRRARQRRRRDHDDRGGRSRLVSIEELLSRTLLFGGVSALLLAVDLLVIAGLTEALGERVSQRNVLLVVLVLSAVLYAPLRLRLAALVRRLVRGDRDHPYGAVAGLAASLETAGDADAQLAAVARAVAPRSASTSPSRSTGPAASGWWPPAAPGRRAPGPCRSATATRPSAGWCCRPGGCGPGSARATSGCSATWCGRPRPSCAPGGWPRSCRHNRERLVVAREEERRRIRRDLHDDLAPTLGGVVFQVDSATLLVDRDPDAARERIAATTEHLRTSSPTCAGSCTTCARPPSTTSGSSARCASTRPP